MRPPHDELGLRACTAWILACAVACSTPDERPSRAREEPRAPATTGPNVAAAAIEDEDDDEPVRDGKYLYTRNCAGCHNDNGDGLGATIVQMGQKARSFAEGHFAFGNTRESIFRTIGSGVPGRSPMPGFAMVLSEDERWMVVDYVRTLMPKEEEVDELLSVMHVKDEPVIVRGMLRPIVEGAPDTPRGLLVGLPGGLTFAYRADDVRLLGVYQGEFVDRRDWYDRGGSKLKPLGQLIYAVDEGDPKRGVQVAFLRDSSQWLPPNEPLVKTRVQGRAARICAQTFEEVPSAVQLTAGVAWRRRVNSRSNDTIRVPVGSTSIANSVDMTGLARTSTDGRLPHDTDIAMIAQPHATFVEYTVVVHPEGKGLVRADDGWSIPIEASSEVAITTVLLASADAKRIGEVLKDVLP